MFDAPPLGDHALMQDPAFAAALVLCGQSPRRLPSGHIVLCRRVAGLRVAMLPRATPPPDLKRQMCAAGLAGMPLIVSPETPAGRWGLPLRKPQMAARLQLDAPLLARRAALNGKWRHQLGHAEKSALRVRHGPLRPTDDLPQRDAQQAASRGYRNWPAALTHAFARAAPHQTQVFTATLRGHPVAWMLFLLHGGRATYHIGLTTGQGRALHAHNLILWQAQNWLAGQQITQLDLGLLDPRNRALNRFKLRTGAVATPTGGSFLYWTPFASRG